MGGKRPRPFPSRRLTANADPTIANCDLVKATGVNHTGGVR